MKLRKNFFLFSFVQSVEGVQQLHRQVSREYFKLVGCDHLFQSARRSSSLRPRHRRSENKHSCKQTIAERHLWFTCTLMTPAAGCVFRLAIRHAVASWKFHLQEKHHRVGPTGESSATGQINPECPMTNDLKEFLRFNDGMYVVPIPGSCKPD